MKPLIIAFAMAFIPFLASANSYDKLWKQVRTHEDNGLPKSAYAVTQDILRKARRDGNRGQALSARLKAAALHQEWAPDSFFTDIAELEALRREETTPEARAIYASVLAWLYEANRHRSQATDVELEATDMREWSRAQYDSSAISNWHQTMADLPMLARAKSRDWLPFVELGDQSAYYRHDLLHILWQRYKEQRSDVWHQTRRERAAMAQRVIETYKAMGNREAALLVTLDYIHLQDEASDSDLLRRCIEEYGDLPLCTEAYLALATRVYNYNNERAEKIAICRECLQRYPRYERRDAVRAMLADLLQPKVTWRNNKYFYPGNDYEWVFGAYNTQSLHLRFLRLPDDVQPSTLRAKSDAEALAWLRKHATPVDSLLRTFANSPVGEAQTDTIRWKAYEPGAYALIATATTTESEASRPTMETYSLFFCSRLQTLQQDGLGSLRTIVVDAMSGHPVQGAQVEFYAYDKEQRHTIANIHTDAEGRAALPESQVPSTLSSRRIYSKVTVGTDHWFTDDVSYLYSNTSEPQKPERQLRLYTDRAIYRPGQTVHVGGIVFEQLHWEGKTVPADTSVELTLMDANWKEVATATATTDDMGAFATTFTLPAKGLPGVYHIRCHEPSRVIDLRVEEYKRPTFEVTMDEAPDLRLPAPAITLTGRAMGYNGVPVRQARVVGTFRFTYPRWWWRSLAHEDSAPMPLDTVTTDADGAFAVSVPLTSLTREALATGLCLEVNVDVLNTAGETRHGTIAVPLCTRPLRVRLTVPQQQERSHLSPVGIQLISSTEKPTDGTVRWQLFPAADGKRAGDEAVATGTIASRERAITFPTDTLAAIPSGQYELHVSATAGTDSAEAKAYFLVFGLDDTRLPKQTPEWLYCPDDTFAPGHPAQVQVGTSLADVAFYYSIVAADHVVEEHLITLSDEMRTLTIPYKESYGDGATLHTAFVKEGRPYTNSQKLYRPMPERTLKWEWLSFRDRLRPGQQETWTLRITRPDGTPAPAQLMATLYDASLDAIAPHSWHLLMDRFWDITALNWTARQLYVNNSNYYAITFPLHEYRVHDMRYDAFAETWFHGLGFGYAMEERLLMDAMPAPMAMRESRMAKATNATMLREVAVDTSQTKVVTEESADEDTGATVAAPPADVHLRSDFAETAAFMPRLQADADGVVALTFTLPESLTTWQLMALAHTTDMMSATIRAQATARKDFMAQLALPRFLRSGDKASLRATVQNLTERTLNGTATLEVFDPETEKVVLRSKSPFTAEANGEALLTFDYTPTELPSVVAVRLVAQAGTLSDGEQRYLPILPSSTWVTESVEIRADSLGTFTTDLTPLFNHDSPTATNRRLTVEYTTHPIWYALQALPSLRTPQSDDVVSLATAFCAEALAAHIANTTPRLRTLVELWRQEQAQGQPSLASRLAEDEELKQIILDETPWLREAESDADRKARLIDLLDAAQQHSTLTDLASRLGHLQTADGGFTWFPGMMASPTMTHTVMLVLAHHRQLTDDYATLPADVRTQVKAMLDRGVAYLAGIMAREVEQLRKHEKEGAAPRTDDFAYATYIYITQRAGVSLTNAQKTDVSYLLDHMRGSIADISNTDRAWTALALSGAGRRQDANRYFASLLEHSTTTSERGTFFDYAGGSFTPTSHKLIVHTTAMEAARELAPADKALHKRMRRWLMQQKRTQMWESCILTSEAIYALLADNRAALDATTPDAITLHYAQRQVSVGRADAVAAIAGLGFVKQQLTDGEAPRTITVERRTDSEAWGAVFATYLTPIADATATATGLSVRREVSNATPAVGERITTRYVIRADRDYEYVCLSAPRPACAEPAQQLSGYEWRNGLGYYRAMHDTRTDYFFDHLPKGTYVLEETAYIDRTGTYSTGLVTLRCLYAPEYSSTTPSATITPHP